MGHEVSNGHVTPCKRSNSWLQYA